MPYSVLRDQATLEKHLSMDGNTHFLLRSLTIPPTIPSPPLSSNVVDREKKEAELKGQTVKCEWETKCGSAEQLFFALFATAEDYAKVGKEPNVVEMTRDTDFNKKLMALYNKDPWRLTRFDTGAYWLEVE